MADYVDLSIHSDAIQLDSFGLPLLIDGRASIAQDIKHMVRETGLLVEMVGERNAERVKRNMVRIERHVEDDARIRPGTARVTRVNTDTFYLTAQTIKYGDLEVHL